MLTPKRVQAGQPFKPSASGWNAMADYVRGHQAGATGTGDPRLPGIHPALTVLVRNDTGAELPVRAVLTPGDPVVSAVDLPHQVQAEPYFAADAPGSSTDCVVVTLEPIADGAVGRAVIAGVAVVEVSVSDAAHEFAAPIAATTARLASAASGPVRIIWKGSGTGNKRAVVLLGAGADGGGTVKGKLDGTLSFGGSATMSVWAYNGAAEADTGDNLTVYDWLLSSGQTVASGTRVTAAYDARSGRYYVTGAQCS